MQQVEPDKPWGAFARSRRECEAAVEMVEIHKQLLTPEQWAAWIWTMTEISTAFQVRRIDGTISGLCIDWRTGSPAVKGEDKRRLLWLTPAEICAQGSRWRKQLGKDHLGRLVMWLESESERELCLQALGILYDENPDRLKHVKAVQRKLGLELGAHGMPEAKPGPSREALAAARIEVQGVAERMQRH